MVSLSSLDEDDLEDLQAQMRRLKKQIHLEFQKFFDKVFTSFRDSKTVDRDKLVMTLMNEETIFEKEELNQTSTVSDVFMLIKQHCSYFNYEVLQTLIEVNGSGQDKRCLEEYTQTFSEYCKSVPCTEGVYGSESAESKRTKLRFKLDYDLERLNPCAVKAIKDDIARHLGVRPSSLYLCQVKDGCVLLEFLVPTFIVERIFPLSKSQLLPLYSHVRLLTIEKEDNHEKVHVLHTKGNSG